jgi:hypothetical protein
MVALGTGLAILVRPVIVDHVATPVGISAACAGDAVSTRRA